MDGKTDNVLLPFMSIHVTWLLLLLHALCYCHILAFGGFCIFHQKLHIYLIIIITNKEMTEKVSQWSNGHCTRRSSWQSGFESPSQKKDPPPPKSTNEKDDQVFILPTWHSLCFLIKQSIVKRTYNQNEQELRKR